MYRLIIISVIASFAFAPATHAQEEPIRKDPALGTVLGALVPGAGHYYAGERGTAALLFAGSATPTFVVIADRTMRSDHLRENRNTYYTIAGLITFTSWVYSVADGARAVRRHNRRHGLASVDVSPTVMDDGAGTRLALSVRLNLH